MMEMLKSFLDQAYEILKRPLNILLFILGAVWVCIYFYLRLFRGFAGYKIEEIKASITDLGFLFLLLVILIHFLTIIFIGVGWYKKKYNKETGPWVVYMFAKVSQFFNLILWKPLDILYKIIEKDIPGSGRFFMYLEDSFMSVWSTKKKVYPVYLIILLFDVIPKITSALLFFIDVVLFAQIKYFLFALPFLLVPLGFKLFLNLMDSFGNNNIPVLCEYFDKIIGLGDPQEVYGGAFIIFSQYKLVVSSEYVGVIDPLEEFNIILKLQNIIIRVHFIKLILDEFSQYTTILCSSLYLIAGVVRLYLLSV